MADNDAQQQALYAQQAAMQQQAALQQQMFAGHMGSGVNMDVMQQQMMQRAQWAAAMGMQGMTPTMMAQPHVQTGFAGYQSKVPLTQDVSEEQPTYVNAKQYRRIIKRRQARAKLEAKWKIPGRRAFLHKSRHEHACRRPRGPSGRFLTKAELEERKVKDAANAASKDENL